MPSRQRDKLLPVGAHECAGTADEQRAGPTLHERFEGGLDVSFGLDVED